MGYEFLRGNDLAAGQLRDELAVHRRDLEVEARQVAVHGEARCCDMVAHRARGPVADFCLEHVPHEPAEPPQNPARLTD
jgi:hypothetical protein